MNRSRANFSDGPESGAVIVDPVWRDGVRRSVDHEWVLLRLILRGVDRSEQPHPIAHRDQVLMLRIVRPDPLAEFTGRPLFRCQRPLLSLSVQQRCRGQYHCETYSHKLWILPPVSGVEPALDWMQEPSRLMQDSGLIVSDPNIMMGKPVIRGTRITVELILEKFATGYSEDEVLRAYPHISREAIRAALAFAAEALQASVLYPLERAAS